ncbi:AraC family transcriptional regulator [Paraburkholderia hospita]|uniref:AraC family transcriptional regulator n=1 Tax=Paraburkholderia hospita TaxID=169430 RepID=UPI000B342B82|nr:AraC family transcriptional regulator [Paraburkholderia hospita]OUL77938.1 AraC family transcriptional regulator [Paraburkholderia hospita]
MDAVSDVLHVVHLRGAVYLNATFTAPWCVIGRPIAALCAAYLPRCERVVSYHLITDGSCRAQLADNPSSALQLNAGELLVVPQGETHMMGSSLDLTPAPVELLLSQKIEAAPGEVMTLSYGDGGTPTRMVCGFLACDDTLSNPLLSSLPRIFKIDIRNEPRAAWLEASLRFAAAEAADSRVGGTIVLARLSELLFVESVRCCVEALPPDQTGWLAGVRDRFVGRALSLLHAQPLHPWTVDELASAVGLSRSALGQRFTDLLGRPPMQYLARWRMQIAAQELLIRSKSLASIAEQIGYESEAAFSRAFRREFGMPPASWRKNQRKVDGAAESGHAAPAARGTVPPDGRP